MRILHLSDLHYSKGNQYDIGVVLEALSKDLQSEVTSEGAFDFALFTGDLARSGQDKDELRESYDRLCEVLLNGAGLSSEAIFFCPGNHDISREVVRDSPAIEQGLVSRLDSPKGCTTFLQQVESQNLEALLAIERCGNFYSVIDHGSADQNSLFYRTASIVVKGVSVGIAMLNSSWRATGEANDVDKSKLWIGEQNIDLALERLSGSDFKIALFHHPLEWLHPEDRQISGSRLKASFDLLCFGHLHDSEPTMTQDSFGRHLASQAPSLFQGRSLINGYHIIEIDPTNEKARFKVREYVNRRRSFDRGTRSVPDGETTFNIKTQIRPERSDQVALFLRGKRNLIRQMAEEHLDFTQASNKDGSLSLDNYVIPPLRKHNYEIEVDGNPVDKSDYDLACLLDEGKNLSFMGDRQCGKTSLLYYIARLFVDGESQTSIPVFIDLTTFKYNTYSLNRQIAKNYGTLPSGFKLDNAIENGFFTFLIDECSSLSETDLAKLAEYCSKDKNRWITFSTLDEGSFSSDRIVREAFPKFERVYIDHLTRKDIRKLSSSWAVGTAQNGNDVFNAVINQINKDGLPKSPYMVTLLIWAYITKRNQEKINEAQLLDLVIDHLLGKVNFSDTRRDKMDTKAKRIILRHLASLLKQCDHISSNDALEALVAFFRSRRLPFDASDTLNDLIVRGIIAKDNGSIKFKYRCFQEFFIAEELADNQDSLSNLFESLEYLDYRREIELATGIRKEGKKAISLIRKILSSRAPIDFQALNRDEFDMFVAKERKVGTKRSDLNKLRSTRLSSDQIDEIMDEADRRSLKQGESKTRSERIADAGGNLTKAAKEVEAEYIERDKELNDKSPLSPSTFMASVALLGQVVKNADFTSFEEKYTASSEILSSWSKVYVLMMNEIRDIITNVRSRGTFNITDDEFSNVDYIFRKIYFDLIGCVVIETLSTPTLAETVSELFSHKGNTSAEDALILFLLEDMDSIDWQDRWAVFISNKDSNGFMIDCLIDRMYRIRHTKALDDKQQARLDRVIDAVEHKLGWSKQHKSDVLQNTNAAETLAKLRA